MSFPGQPTLTRRVTRTIVTVTALGVLAAPVHSQHSHPATPDSGGSGAAPMSIRHAASRMASGTAWDPDAAPSTARHLGLGRWHLMLDGRGTVQYVRTTGIRRQWQLGSANWLMGMASRDLAGGVAELRVMLSGEPATLARMGYPLLAQVAQEYRGGMLTDRQHPHELFTELAIRLARPIAPGLGVEVYLAPAGEPASGPVAYRHRASAVNDPVAPLGHHAQDITHTSFGVATLGLFGRGAKLEGSLFNARHPDERRTGVDLGGVRLDSWAARITVTPAAALAFSASYARFARTDDPAHAAGHAAAHRVTASVMHTATWRAGRTASTSVIYGTNLREGASALPATLIETNADLGAISVFGRAEQVRRSAEELALTGSVPSELTMRVLSLGMASTLRRFAGVELGGGIRAAVHVLPGELAPFYGGRRPLTLAGYISAGPSPARIDAR